MGDSRFELAFEPAQEQGNRLLRRICRWLGGLALGVIGFLLATRVGVLPSMGMVFGILGLGGGRILVTSQREVRGARARWLGVAWFAQGCGASLLGYFEKTAPAMFQAHLVPATVAVCWVGFVALWALSAALSRPRNEDLGGETAPAHPDARPSDP